MNSDALSPTPDFPAADLHSDALITVRQAMPDDAQEVHGVVSECMRIYCRNSEISFSMTDASFETVDDVQAAISYVPFFVAVDSGGCIVGSVRLLTKQVSSFGVEGLADMLSLNLSENVSYFSRFAVREYRQGLGIGSLLYQSAQAKTKELQFSHMLLHTSLANRIMVAFYEKRGFILLFEDQSRGYPRGLFGKKLV